MIRILLGETEFTELLINLPDQFYLDFSPSTQDAMWKAMLAEINHGITDVKSLTASAKSWIETYAEIKRLVKTATGLEAA